MVAVTQLTNFQILKSNILASKSRYDFSKELHLITLFILHLTPDYLFPQRSVEYNMIFYSFSLQDQK